MITGITGKHYGALELAVVKIPEKLAIISRAIRDANHSPKTECISVFEFGLSLRLPYQPSPSSFKICLVCLWHRAAPGI